ncbi:ScbA/BarX family gamma-butyrolactone biosynthesis protein [Streptomyces sp. TRM68367]|uniref:ScbA/BarX family gamma-butyrolactone biosynthesis protein n=1 Tax=Streptomyces sp. TRM68367 TaxID=2758415 RepID=UPI00165B1CC9|nr:ScbA/BarX family gamma-butyrolactone biosynthesis protein [Streptomyces sp. TRM68367]MBC9725831.1 A-factor biosynthesis protein [Streptomyces sp. TRM68367]
MPLSPGPTADPHPSTATTSIRPLATVRALSFRTTVDRDRVHRAALGETFVTDSVSVTDDLFLCGAQLPRSHAYYGDVHDDPKHFDVLLVLEAVRQAVMLGAHEYYGLAADVRFILTHNRIEIRSLPSLVIGTRPAHLTLNIRVTDKRVRDGVVCALSFYTCLTLDGTEVARVTMGMAYKSPDSYRRLRTSGRLAAGLPGSADAEPVVPVSPCLVGRNDAANVVLGEPRWAGETLTAPVRVDQSHPSMFDHPQDHVPGMVMNEAFRQIAVLAADAAHALHPSRGRLTLLDVTYTRFGELDLATTATARPRAAEAHGDALFVPVELALRQRGEDIATAVAELTYPEAAGGAA